MAGVVPGQTGIINNLGNRPGYLAARLRQGLAILAGEQLRQFILAGLEACGPVQQQLLTQARIL
ncbi:hypothetical protein D9M68_937020 [compost metagenome]